MTEPVGDMVGELIKMQEKLASYLALPPNKRKPWGPEGVTITAEYGYALNEIVLGLVRRLS